MRERRRGGGAGCARAVSGGVQDCIDCGLGCGGISKRHSPLTESGEVCMAGKESGQKTRKEGGSMFGKESAQRSRAGKKLKVLFFSAGDAVRSQMAEGF